MSKNKTIQPELIRIVNLSKKILEVDFNYNTCDIRMNVDNEYGSITLNEFEAKKLRNALSRFLDFREHLRLTQ